MRSFTQIAVRPLRVNGLTKDFADPMIEKPESYCKAKRTVARERTARAIATTSMLHAEPSWSDPLVLLQEPSGTISL